MPDDHPDRVALGRRIKSARLSRGMTAKDLASAARVSPSYLSEVERGASAISTEKLVRIARCLGVSLEFLLEGRSEEPPGGDVRIPAALSDAAEQLNLSYAATIRLLEGRESLIARRSRREGREWEPQDWIDFYNRVKNYLQE